MKFIGVLSPALLTLGLAVAPAAADSSPSASPSEKDGAPTRAGTSFRTATELDQGQRATASGSTGDYLYWSFPADAGQRPTVRATLKLPDPGTRKAAETWQVDVYDGLRRRQACQYGTQTRTAARDTAELTLSCTLRTVRGWSEQWANDPLPGTYYIRLTAVSLPAAESGLPISAEIRTEVKEIGGAAAVDGSLARPLVPGAAKSESEPEDGWSSGWWSDRWVWTALGGILAAFAGIGGYTLTRGSGRPAPPA